MVTPDCIGDFLSFIISDISDGKMVSGNSLYKDKLNQKIANAKLSFHSYPRSNEIADGYFITSDGYVAENSTIIDKGVLKTHLFLPFVVFSHPRVQNAYLIYKKNEQH